VDKSNLGFAAELIRFINFLFPLMMLLFRLTDVKQLLLLVLVRHAALLDVSGRHKRDVEKIPTKAVMRDLKKMIVSSFKSNNFEHAGLRPRGQWPSQP
jgi:hypothetical protein